MADSIIFGDALPLSPAPFVRSRVRIAAAMMAIFFLGFGTWSALAPLESAAMAPGAVVSQSNRKTIQHLEDGIIAQILVRNGDEVKAGQTLIRLDDTDARTKYQALLGELWETLAREARLLAERDNRTAIQFSDELIAHRGDHRAAEAMAGQQKILDTRRALLESKIGAVHERIDEVREEIGGLQAQEAAVRRRSALLNVEIRGAQELVDKGLESKWRQLQRQRDLADMEGRRGDLVAQIARAKQTIAEAEVNILTLRNDEQKQVADDLRDTQKQILDLRQRVDAASGVLARVDIKAPQDGVVTDLKVHTPGGVINKGEALMDLVPKDDRLVAEVQVRPEDIDRVHEGLPAQIRLLPYKQRRTPPLDARVVYVSADRLIEKETNKPYYAARLQVDEKQLAAMPDVKMVPGMPVEAMIQTGKTTVALYALSPLVDSFHHAFREK